MALQGIDLPVRIIPLKDLIEPPSDKEAEKTDKEIRETRIKIYRKRASRKEPLFPFERDFEGGKK